MKVMRKDEAQHMDWDWAPAYVAKSFLNPDVEQNKCIDDVKQQMLAKHYAQHYNARDPPKSIDFLQASYVKLLNRRPVELMAMEVSFSTHPLPSLSDGSHAPKTTRV